MHNVHCDPAIALIRRHPDGIRFEVEYGCRYDNKYLSSRDQA